MGMWSITRRGVEAGAREIGLEGKAALERGP